jgi:RimJ/RimL family protein N-acetyltransferase
MSLLFGNWKNTEFNNQFKEYALNINQIRNSYEWMQTFPDEWDDTLSNLFGNELIKSTENSREAGIIELNTRVNFRFSLEKYQNIKKDIISDVEIVKIDKNIFRNMPGTVTPKHFWNNENDFLENGLGYSLFYNGELAATAFSSCKFDNIVELGIETVEEFRGKGFAKIACFAILDYCIANKFIPIWSCRLENTGSYILAQKLGFEEAYKKPYYRLSK